MGDTFDPIATYRAEKAKRALRISAPEPKQAQRREPPDQPSGVSSVGQARNAKVRGKVGRASRQAIPFGAAPMPPNNRATVQFVLSATPEQIAALGAERADAFMRGIALVIVAAAGPTGGDR